MEPHPDGDCRLRSASQHPELRQRQSDANRHGPGQPERLERNHGRSMEPALRGSDIEPRSRGVLKQRCRLDRHGKWARSLHHLLSPTGEHLYDCHSKPVRSQSGPHQRGRRRQFQSGHDRRCKRGHGAGSRNIALRPRGGSGGCGEHSGPGRHAPERKLLGVRGRDATLVQ